MFQCDSFEPQLLLCLNPINLFFIVRGAPFAGNCRLSLSVCNLGASVLQAVGGGLEAEVLQEQV